ncbi:MAG: polysaccharide pyruvyl transferase family protein [Faecousia sp.]
MKIGIVTIYESITNMGSFLQAYALKTVLEQLGHEVCFIQNVPTYKTAANLLFRLNPKRELLLRVSKCWNFYKDTKQLKLVPKEELNSHGLDLLVYGSDEIWNLENAYFRDPLFWGIGQSQIRKIAYAISIGAMEETVAMDFPKLIDGLSDFAEIFARDERTHSFLEKRLSYDPKFVCDPTILLPLEYLTKPGKKLNKKYLLVYTYGLDGEMEKLVVNFARRKGLKIVSPCFWHVWADKVIECSALELSSLMADAEYVFTTTFHGAIFSLLNHKQCCIFPVREKVADVVKRLGEESRLIDEHCNEKHFEEILNMPFDSEDFENRVKQWRESSMQQLREALECSGK